MMIRVKKILKKIKEKFLEIFFHNKTFYFIYEVDENYTPTNLVTILSKRKQFATFVINHYCSKSEHFIQWCENHHVNKEDQETKLYYYNLNKESVPYYIEMVKLKKKDVAVYLRIFYGLKPVGAPYEKDFESLINLLFDDEGEKEK